MKFNHFSESSRYLFLFFSPSVSYSSRFVYTTLVVSHSDPTLKHLTGTFTNIFISLVCIVVQFIIFHHSRQRLEIIFHRSPYLFTVPNQFLTLYVSLPSFVLLFYGDGRRDCWDCCNALVVEDSFNLRLFFSWVLTMLEQKKKVVKEKFSSASQQIVMFTTLILEIFSSFQHNLSCPRLLDYIFSLLYFYCTSFYFITFHFLSTTARVFCRFKRKEDTKIKKKKHE